MKTSMEIRMQCVSLANTLACGKHIQPKDVIPQAMEYLKWIEGWMNRPGPTMWRGLLIVSAAANRRLPIMGSSQMGRHRKSRRNSRPLRRGVGDMSGFDSSLPRPI